MNCEIICVGTELILGDIVNTNSQYLSSELASLGINVYFHTTVGDNPTRLKSALAIALKRSNLVIITGGLGPTNDDITTQTVSEAFGLELIEHEESLKQITDYFLKNNLNMSSNNYKQALIPKGATVFPNDNGTAPGYAIEGSGYYIVILPGPPAELKPMFEKYVRKYLSKFSTSRIISHTLNLFGIGEAQIAEKVADLMQSSNPTLAPYAKNGQVQLRITASGTTVDECEFLAESMIEEIYNRLGDYIYGKDVTDLQEVVVNSLIDKGLKIATAESCTGGLLSKRITEISGASKIFDYGIVAYSDEVKISRLGVKKSTIDTYGAVSAQTAAAMALGACQNSGSDIGIGITGIAGPTGGTDSKQVGQVFIALTDLKFVWVKELYLDTKHKRRDRIRHLAVLNTLDLVRRYINSSGKMEGGFDMNSGMDDRFLQAITVTKVKTADNQRLSNNPIIKKAKSLYNSIIPWKGENKLDIIRRSILLVAIIAFIGSAGYIGNYLIGSLANNMLSKKLADVYNNPDPDIELPDGMLRKFAGLWKENKDIAGWIEIPGTNINYPVVQSGDNDYYLKRDFNGKNSKHGTIFMDYRNDPKALSKNTILYGHNMKDGQMFAALKKYMDVNFYKKAPIIKFDTVYGEYKWKIFAVMITNTRRQEGPVFNYTSSSNINFASGSDFIRFIDEVKYRSLIITPVEVNEDDHILTLSTCTYEFIEARFVVMAKLVKPGEDPTVDVSLAKKNPAPLMPDVWYKHYNGVRPSSSKRPDAGSQSSDDHSTSTSTSRPSASTSSRPSTSSPSTTTSLPTTSQPPTSSIPTTTSQDISTSMPPSTSEDPSSDIISSEDPSSDITSSEDPSTSTEPSSSDITTSEPETSEPPSSEPSSSEEEPVT